MRLYTKAIGPAFDNVGLHKAVIFEVYLKCDGETCMDGRCTLPTLIPLIIFRITSAVLCGKGFPTSASIAEFQTSTGGMAIT